MNERKPPLFGLHIVQAHGQLEPADYGVDFPDFLHSDLVSDSEHRTLYLKNGTFSGGGTESGYPPLG